MGQKRPKVVKLQLTLREILNLQPAMAQLGEAKRVPITTANKLARIQKKFKDELEIFRVNREKLLTELGEADPDNPANTRVKPENQAVFREQMEEAMNEEITLQFRPVALSAVGDKIEVNGYQNIVATLLDTVLVDDGEDQDELDNAEPEEKEAGKGE
jgi:hypothetical protein